MKPARPFTVVQTPAPLPLGKPAPITFDRSHPAPVSDMLRITWMDGQAQGVRQGYTQGWRWGLVCGAATLGSLQGLLAAVAHGLGLW
jgi:hypothetical protein